MAGMPFIAVAHVPALAEARARRRDRQLCTDVACRAVQVGGAASCAPGNRQESGRLELRPPRVSLADELALLVVLLAERDWGVHAEVLRLGSTRDWGVHAEVRAQVLRERIVQPLYLV
jgi:hypothetical protein